MRGRVLLHSARDDDGLGAWSFAAAEPSATLIARGRSIVRLDENGRPAKRFTADPFEAVFTHTAGGTASVSITAYRKWLTS